MSNFCAGDSFAAGSVLTSRILFRLMPRQVSHSDKRWDALLAKRAVTNIYTSTVLRICTAQRNVQPDTLRHISAYQSKKYVFNDYQNRAWPRRNSVGEDAFGKRQRAGPGQSTPKRTENVLNLGKCAQSIIGWQHLSLYIMIFDGGTSACIAAQCGTSSCALAR